MRTSTILLHLIAISAVSLNAMAVAAEPVTPTTKPSTRPSALPPDVLPDGLGVNIHFTDPAAGEMEMLAAGGFSVVRMDFAWGGIERKAGEYDFAAYDRLVAACEAKHVQPMFILDYSNRLYDGNLSPHTEEGRAAFARWAAASAVHFKGRGVIWEMYNEPNIQFWRPRPNVDDYAKLALAVGKALREAAPDETYVGPATSTIDLPFLETCFRAGLLDYWSAVSVHPYRQTDPETVLPEYLRLRRLIRQYAPKGKPVPILSGEWGYSTGWKNFDEPRQAKYLARQWLTNLYAEVPVSIWYDWHDDGRDPKEAEHHFGTVHNEYRKGNEPVYEPKPSYLAAKVLTSSLGGYRYNKRLAAGDPASDFVLLFDKGGHEGDLKDVKLAVWTTAKAPHPLTIAVSPGAFHVVDHLGQAKDDLTADDKGLTVPASDAPLYLTPAAANDLLRLATAVERVPLDTYLAGGGSHSLFLRIRNPLAEPIRAIGSTTGLFEPHLFPIDPGNAESIPCRAYVYRDAEPRPLTVQVEVRERCIVQQWTSVIATNPLGLSPLTPAGGKLSIRVNNPTGEGFDGTLFLTDVDGDRQVPSRRLSLDEGQREAVVQVPFPGDPGGPYRFGMRVEDRDHNIALKLPPATYRPIDDFARLAAQSSAGADAWRVVAEGDSKVASEQSLVPAAPQEGGVAPGVASVEVRYRFDPGHKFLRVEPTSDERRKIDGRPRTLGLWVKGDGKGGMARIRFTDSTGQTFQPDGGRVTWQGWRYVTFALTGGANMGHWGGANDGTIHYPIRLDTLFLLDNVSREKLEGSIGLASPVLVFP